MQDYHWECSDGGRLTSQNCNESCGCFEMYDIFWDAYNAVIKVFDGSNYVENSGSCDDSSDDSSCDSTVSGNSPTISGNTITKPEADAATAQALRTNGVTVDTGVWYSFNLSVYEMIENAGIPVTLKFTYEGQRYSVTIPAGAKVTELCDEKGWCGFLNLAAHYGFELL